MTDTAKKRTLRRQRFERWQSDGYVTRVCRSIERSERRRADQEAVEEEMEDDLVRP